MHTCVTWKFVHVLWYNLCVVHLVLETIVMGSVTRTSLVVQRGVLNSAVVTYVRQCLVFALTYSVHFTLAF